MDMVKVDPKLFITCRLCLKEMGMYQITPSVQQQIKYCFDIDVDQFDGLPQLICGECETILSEYFAKKRLFVGLQNALKTKLEIRKELDASLCPSPPHEVVSSSQQNDNESPSISRRTTPKPKKRKRIISSSSSSSDIASRDASVSPAHSNKSNLNIDNQKLHAKKRPRFRREHWEANYNKTYCCKLCNKTLKYNNSIKTHIRTHVNLLSKYKELITKPCKVELVKIDNKPNPTGDNGTVALTKNKIIREERDFFYIFFSKKSGNSSELIQTEQTIESDDSSSTVSKSRNNKRLRLLSRSSTDTVILNGDKQSVASDEEVRFKTGVIKSVNLAQVGSTPVECINIDDSSNSSHPSDCVPAKDNENPKPKDVETIKNLIRVCYNKYVSKKQEMIEHDTKKAANKDPKLKQKLLSMGRKVINKQGLPCTGLLRFMENKDLAAKWRPVTSSQKETNYIRIMPRLKGREELFLDNIGWQKKPATSDEDIHILRLCSNKTTKTAPKNVAVCRNNSDESVSKKDAFNNSARDIFSTTMADLLSDPPNSCCPFTANPSETANGPSASVPNPSVTIIPLFTELGNLSGENTFDKKLLNQNPVANPKQLPKKSNLTETKLLIGSKNAPHSNNAIKEPICIDLEEDHQQNDIMCMPIITSTTSLAVSTTDNAISFPTENAHESNEPNEKSNEEPDEKKNEKQAIGSENNGEGAGASAPRIKVKPASELMSERVLKNLGQQQSTPDNIWNQNMNAPVSKQMGSNMTQVTSAGAPVDVANVVPNSNACTFVQNTPAVVVLDTVELPNTKTSSPIHYLKLLLQMHNIILLDSCEPVPPSAVCLIKFKLQLVRETTNHPVTLCLSVHNIGNIFSLAVRDPNQVTYVDLNQLNAHWQWEILKIYIIREDVITKLLLSAQKIGQEVYDYTKKFLCLLKSVNFKKVEDTE